MNKHIVVLQAMINGLKKRPAWYEGASEEGKAKFDAWNEEKKAALKYAVDTLSDIEKLKALSDKARKIADAIDSVMEGAE